MGNTSDYEIEKVIRKLRYFFCQKSVQYCFIYFKAAGMSELKQ